MVLTLANPPEVSPSRFLRFFSFLKVPILASELRENGLGREREAWVVRKTRKKFRWGRYNYFCSLLFFSGSRSLMQSVCLVCLAWLGLVEGCEPGDKWGRALGGPLRRVHPMKLRRQGSNAKIFLAANASTTRHNPNPPRLDPTNSEHEAVIQRDDRWIAVYTT